MADRVQDIIQTTNKLFVAREEVATLTARRNRLLWEMWIGSPHLTVEDIAKAGGISKARFYQIMASMLSPSEHFDSKRQRRWADYRSQREWKREYYSAGRKADPQDDYWSEVRANVQEEISKLRSEGKTKKQIKVVLSKRWHPDAGTEPNEDYLKVANAIL